MLAQNARKANNIRPRRRLEEFHRNIIVIPGNAGQEEQAATFLYAKLPCFRFCGIGNSDVFFPAGGFRGGLCILKIALPLGRRSICS